MAELEDLRGREIAWKLTSRRPLRCVISVRPDGRGSLVQDAPRAPVRAALAGVWWDLESDAVGDTVAFAESGLIIARAGGRYSVRIDDLANYQLKGDPKRERLIWIDDQGRQVVIFHRHTQLIRGESGEITVLNTMSIEHAPVLILLGLLRIGRKPAFSVL